MRTVKVLGAAMAVMMGMMGPAPTFAADDKDRENSEVNEVVVTAAVRVRQGGSQDINHFRGEAAEHRMPFPDDITPEGLMGGYDLVLGAGQPCAQLFCLTGEAMPVSLAGRPDDRLLVGLGFNSNIDAAKWRREPLNLVAVVDKSGSMDGEPLDHVRAALRQIVSQMRPGDQISIVLYGDRSYQHLKPTMITALSKPGVNFAIDHIVSAGSTNMEEGLQVGYDTAFETQKHFKGVTRVMLFTDEQPNVGATDAGSFMGMAEAASERGIGLTTIGVGVQFDSALADQIASVRGGNLFFMRDEADVKAVFSAQLDTMVTQLAYDVKIRVRPLEGYRITGVFGVPGDMLKDEGDGSVSFTVSTAFLSTHGGGVFVTLGAADRFLPTPANTAGAPLITAQMSYIAAADGKPGASTVTVAAPSGPAGANLKLASVLIGEFLDLKLASTQFHAEHDPEAAYQTLRGLSSRLAQADDDRLKPERELVGQLYVQTAFLSGHQAEPGLIPASVARRPSSLALAGAWTIVEVKGDVDLHRGDTLRLGDDNQASITRATPIRGQDDEESDTYEANGSQLMLRDSNVMYSWHLTGDLLVLYDDTHEVTLRLRRAAQVASTD